MENTDTEQKSRDVKHTTESQEKGGVKKIKKVATKSNASSTHSKIGSKFVDYYQSRNKDPWKNIPKVEVCFKILTIEEIDVVGHSFSAEFVMMYDWVDESLSSVLNSSSSSVVDINWSEHFQPNVAVDNCISSNPVGGASEPRVKSASKCRVTLTRRIQAKLRSRFDLKRYPFDHQFLEIRLKSRRVPQSGPHSATVVLSNPTTFRGKLGHILDPEADWMPEWNIVKIDGAPDGANSDFYRMQVCILRESTSVMTNIVLSLAVIMLLSFTSYGIEIDDFQDRVQVNVTLLLATMTFKFVLGKTLFFFFVFFSFLYITQTFTHTIQLTSFPLCPT